MVRNIAVDRHGSIYVAAQTNGALPDQTSAGDRDAVVMKFDRNGNPVWTYQFGSAGFEEAIGVTVRGHDVYATGVTRSVLPGQVSAGETDGFVIKLDAKDGELLWLRQFGSAGSDSPWKVRVIGRGVFASGHTTGNLGGTNAGVLDPFLVRMNPDGDIEWIRQFGSPAQDFAVAMTVHAGGIAIGGSTRGPMPGQVHYGDGDFYVREYGPDGEERWTLQWGTADLNSLSAVGAKGDALYVAGHTVGALPGQIYAGGQDAVVIRLPDMGDRDDQDGADEEDDD
jgi:outer membrane protein assembly factor BamB